MFTSASWPWPTVPVLPGQLALPFVEKATASGELLARTKSSRTKPAYQTLAPAALRSPPPPTFEELFEAALREHEPRANNAGVSPLRERALAGERPEALAQGYDFYFTGRPCKRGHVALRQASDRGCVACASLHNARAVGAKAAARAHRRRAGLCIDCRAGHVKRAAPGRVRCDGCLAKGRRQNVAQRAASLSAGKCVICRIADYAPGRAGRCGLCYDKMRASANVGGGGHASQKAAQQRRRARKAAADDGTVTAAAWRERLCDRAHKCAYCGKRIGDGELHVAHVLALHPKAGEPKGRHSMRARPVGRLPGAGRVTFFGAGFIEPACAACNLAASNKRPEVYALERLQAGLAVYAKTGHRHFAAYWLDLDDEWRRAA